MLILTRNCGEAIHIGPNVQIRILGISGNQVRIGVAAPADVAIFRSELVNIPDVAAKLRAGGAVDMVVAEEGTDA